jgi:hypothetical protein
MTWLILGTSMFMSNASLASPGDIEVLSQETTLIVKGPAPKAAFEKAESFVAGILELYRPAAVGYSEYQVTASGPEGYRYTMELSASDPTWLTCACAPVRPTVS